MPLDCSLLPLLRKCPVFGTTDVVVITVDFLNVPSLNIEYTEGVAQMYFGENLDLRFFWSAFLGHH